MNRVTRMIASVGAMAVIMAGSAVAASAAVSPTLYSSLPVAGTVSIPSIGVEAYSFNQVGNEVVLNRSAQHLKSVSVTMVSWACQTGNWNTGDCVTTPGATFSVPVMLTLYRYSHVRADGARVPGKPFATVTKTFKIHYRPSSDNSCPQENGVSTEFVGKDGQCHHGLDQNIVFSFNRIALPNIVTWGVSYSSDNSGPNPLGGSGAPEDSLNVGLASKVLAGHNRFPRDIFWDTRVADNSGGAPFVPGVFNLDTGWKGYIPAVKFTATKQ